MKEGKRQICATAIVDVVNSLFFDMTGIAIVSTQNDLEFVRNFSSNLYNIV